MENRPDAALMELTARGDTMAFKTLYSRYENRIFNFVLRMTGHRELAQDLIQETFVRLWSSAHMFDPRRGTLKSWLYKMALNIVHTEMRKKVHSQSFAPLEAGYPFQVRSFISLLAESVGVQREDRFKRYMRLASVPAIVGDAREYVSGSDFTVDEVERVLPDYLKRFCPGHGLVR